MRVKKQVFFHNKKIDNFKARIYYICCNLAGIYVMVQIGNNTGFFVLRV